MAVKLHRGRHDGIIHVICQAPHYSQITRRWNSKASTYVRMCCAKIKPPSNPLTLSGLTSNPLKNKEVTRCKEAPLLNVHTWKGTRHTGPTSISSGRHRMCPLKLPLTLSSGLNTCWNPPCIKTHVQTLLSNAEMLTHVIFFEHMLAHEQTPSIKLVSKQTRRGLEHLCGAVYQMLVLKWFLYVFTLWLDLMRKHVNISPGLGGKWF